MQAETPRRWSLQTTHGGRPAGGKRPLREPRMVTSLIGASDAAEVDADERLARAGFWIGETERERQPDSVQRSARIGRALFPHSAVKLALRLRGDCLRALGRVLGRVGGRFEAPRGVLGAPSRPLGALVGTEAGRLLGAGGRPVGGWHGGRVTGRGTR